MTTIKFNKRLCIFLAVITGLLSLLSQTTYAQCTTACTLLWSDEFSDTNLDLTKWSYMIGDGSAYGTPGWGQNEQQYYTANNAVVANGYLTITAKEEQKGGRAYTSSRIRSLEKGDWTYGRFEARIKLPANQGTAGKGTSASVWMLPSDPAFYGFWPSSGEIDVFNWFAHQPQTILGALHYGKASANSNLASTSTNLATHSTNDFHTYAIEWQPDEIRWYLDDELYKTETGWFSSGGPNPSPYPAPFNKAFHLLVNLAVGGNQAGQPDANTVFPQELVIDYVRVYQTEDSVIPRAVAPKIIFDNFEHNDPLNNGWFAFSSDGTNIGGQVLGRDINDVPPQNGGSWAMRTRWPSTGSANYLGGFGRVKVMDLSAMTKFSFWINPSITTNQFDLDESQQSFSLELNIQDDDTGDNIWRPNEDDEFQFVCRISPTGPCAITGAGWQKVEIPISHFTHDISFSTGGTGVLDTKTGGNGLAVNIVAAVISRPGIDINIDTDYWLFEGEIPHPAMNQPLIIAIVLLLLIVLVLLRIRK